ncbi:MAG: hypothetical protein ABSA75_13465 [Candidatus Bathyarchaeia archaeon]
MDFGDAKTGKLIEKGTAASVGFLSFVNAATQKFSYGAGYPVWSKSRIEDAIACVVGGTAVQSLDSTYSAGVRNIQGFQLKPLSAINPTTEAGIAVLVTDWALKEALPNKYYKSLPVVPDVMKGAGIGLLVGGIIGGLFDPAPSGYTITNPSPITGQIETGGIATGNVPYARGGSTSRVYGNGSILA